MAWIFRGKKPKEEFIDNGQTWEEYLKTRDLESTIEKFREAGVEKLGDLFNLQEEDLTVHVKLNIVQLRRFQKAAEDYRKEMKALRRQSVSSPTKEAKSKNKGERGDNTSERSSSSLTTPSPPVLSPSSSTAAMTLDVLVESAETDDVGNGGVAVSGTAEENSSSDPAPPEEGVQEEFYEELDNPSPAIPARPPSIAGAPAVSVPTEEENIYEPPPSEALEFNQPDYEECDDVMPGGSGGPARPPRVRARELAEEPAPAPLPSNPIEWSTSETLRWLKESGHNHFKDVFYANAFTGKQLLALTEASFARAGMTADQVTALLQSINDLRYKRSSSNSMSATSRRPPPAPPAEEKKAKVLYDYEARKDNQLTITADEEVVVVDDSSQWWTVRNAQGKSGKVPSNYLEPIAAAAAPAPEQPIDLDQYEWFNGSMDRAASEDRLRHQLNGTYLVRRNPADPLDLTLSIKGSSGIIHLKLSAVDGKYALGSGSAGNESNSIPELIEHHKRTDIKVTGKEAILLRRCCPK